MLSLRSRLAAGVALVGAAGAGAVGSTWALAAGGPSKATITAIGGPSFVINQYVKDSVRFAPGTIVVRSGGTVTFLNRTVDPHTLSIVAKRDLPKSNSALNNCKICNTLSIAHGVDPNGPPPTGPPPHLVVDVGAPGFDVPGDSIFVGPKASPLAKVSFKVTAKAGTTLQFICIIHPWMQGRLLVK